MRLTGITYQDIALRLLTTVLASGLIGWQREAKHRPAGFRTHIVVAVGAAVTVMVGEECAKLYSGIDVTRIAAQVVAGVGFIGAGTIIHEGANVKGLTTAASVWVTACIGLAFGGGFYVIGAASALIVILSLTLLHLVSYRFLGGKKTSAVFRVICESPAEILEAALRVAPDYGFLFANSSVSDKEGKSTLLFEITHGKANAANDFNRFLAHLSQKPGVSDIGFEME